jgi:ABC-type nitrate/sulfonate/bicarbonate transport system substrate-binding protein
MGYDAQTRQSVVLGKLPGSVDYGTDIVYATVQGGTSFMTGFAARSSAGVVQDVGARVFSFSSTGASSLKIATSRQ